MTIEPTHPIHSQSMDSFIERAAPLMRLALRVKEFARRHRSIILTCATLAFVGGMIFSVRSLGLKASDVAVGPLAILVGLLIPVTIVYSAINMQVMGRAIGTRIRFLDAVRISVFAQVAELLPVPGGAIVRTAALVQHGGGKGKSAGIVIAFALIWIACAAVGGGIALAHILLASVTLVAGGLSVIAVCCLWLAYSSDWRIAALALALRVFGLGIVAARCIAAFAVIGFTLEPVSGLIFAFVIVIGSTASIVPAGLGVGEGLSALVASLAGATAAAGFVVAAINRLAGLALHIVFALVFWALGQQPISDAN